MNGQVLGFTSARTPLFSTAEKIEFEKPQDPAAHKAQVQRLQKMLKEGSFELAPLRPVSPWCDMPAENGPWCLQVFPFFLEFKRGMSTSVSTLGPISEGIVHSGKRTLWIHQSDLILRMDSYWETWAQTGMIES